MKAKVLWFDVPSGQFWELTFIFMGNGMSFQSCTEQSCDFLSLRKSILSLNLLEDYIFLLLKYYGKFKNMLKWRQYNEPHIHITWIKDCQRFSHPFSYIPHCCLWRGCYSILKFKINLSLCTLLLRFINTSLNINGL